MFGVGDSSTFRRAAVAAVRGHSRMRLATFLSPGRFCVYVVVLQPPRARPSTTKVQLCGKTRAGKTECSMALVRTDLRANRRRACLRVAVNDKSKQSNLEGTKNHEAVTTLIQHDQRHISVGVDGRLRYNKQHSEQREHAGGVRL